MAQIGGDDEEYLYCKEGKYYNCGDGDEEEQQKESAPSPLPLYLLQQDSVEEEVELEALLLKEDQETQYLKLRQADSSRREAVQLILRLNSYHAFSPLTALLSVKYLDLFLGTFQPITSCDHVMILHLAAVACLSLAAKMEEPHVPLLLHLQVDDEKSKYMFEPKSIERMELLVLSTLEWKMNPVIPTSFLNHIIKRLSVVNHKQMEFVTLFQLLLLSLITDSRFAQYPPSIFAAATALHVMKQMDCTAAAAATAAAPHIDYYKNQLFDILKFGKYGKLEACYQLIQESS